MPGGTTLFHEHLLQALEDNAEGLGVELPERFQQPLGAGRSQLIERDDYSSQVIVDLLRRDHQTRLGLLDLTAEGRIESDQAKV